MSGSSTYTYTPPPPLIINCSSRNPTTEHSPRKNLSCKEVCINKPRGPAHASGVVTIVFFFFFRFHLYLNFYGLSIPSLVLLLCFCCVLSLGRPAHAAQRGSRFYFAPLFFPVAGR